MGNGPFPGRSSGRITAPTAVRATVALTIGIDPGSRITGYGIVEGRGREVTYIASGIIRATMKSPRPQRLLEIKSRLDEVLSQYRPDAMAVEEIFMSKNPKSTLTLGETRGVILLSAAEAGIPVHEYTPREVKRSIVGAGAAHKSQVAAMVARLLGFDREPETEDETDALAVAFCHMLRMSGAVGRLP
jgi:crossover junction endodeoxyribonuclease RuvC